MELNENKNVIINENYRGSYGEKKINVMDLPIKTIKGINMTGDSEMNEKMSVETITKNPPRTSYVETLMHLFKGNVGPGCYAMADAMRNGGLILGPILTLILGIICVHAQHILVICSEKMKDKYDLPNKPDYAETVELCFSSSKNEKVRMMAGSMKRTCNIFICVTQFGFCCVYFLFVGTNLKQVLGFYGYEFDLHLIVSFSLIPILLSSLITNLKYLAPCSALANVCMITGIIITYYYAVQDLPDFRERNYTSSLHQLPLFFGTAIFAFEGIALVLPLQNAMKVPRNFSKCFGVLNVGMVFVTFIFLSFGGIGYWKYGEDTQGSLTLNLPTDQILAQIVKVAISFGILLGYAIQFYIPIEIMFPTVRRLWKFADSRPLFGERIFRIFMVLVTFSVAILIPNLGLLLSLIGSVCSTVLALVFPPILEYIVILSEGKKIHWLILIKNLVILTLAVLGFVTGGYESIKSIIKEYFV
ncbi:unnamed protein product [Diamesa tonsa]